MLGRLPVHQGETLTSENLQATIRAVREFDEHLRVSTQLSGDSASLRIALSPVARIAAGAEDPRTIRIGGNVQQTKLRSQPRPVYPPEAKQARIQGKVRMQATIAADGTVQTLELIEGHPLLVPAAMDAVRQWVYNPTLLNGNPVSVITMVDVNFTLTQ